MSDDTTDREQLRGMVGTVLPPDLRDEFVEYARLDAFRDESGELDTEKVMGHLTAIHVATQPKLQQPEAQSQQRSWGQHTGQPASRNPGDAGRAALEKRHGVKNPSPSPVVNPGDMARAALSKRYPGR